MPINKLKIPRHERTPNPELVRVKKNREKANARLKAISRTSKNLMPENKNLLPIKQMNRLKELDQIAKKAKLSPKQIAERFQLLKQMKKNFEKNCRTGAINPRQTYPHKSGTLFGYEI
ncbi:MAG: hypothetical protein PHQ98_03665 [Candidatus ainarchaeum sp.]|nr:hypothetical protein [Candidatus ainarchaeum sp.]